MVNEQVANERISMNAIMCTGFVVEVDRIEKLDRLVAVAESRRNTVLREIERRRATFGRSLRGEIQKVAAFEVVESNPRTIKASDEAA
jgi:hypothetical protein